jgi:hypothetical protein
MELDWIGLDWDRLFLVRRDFSSLKEYNDFLEDREGFGISDHIPHYFPSFPIIPPF